MPDLLNITKGSLLDSCHWYLWPVGIHLTNTTWCITTQPLFSFYLYPVQNCSEHLPPSSPMKAGRVHLRGTKCTWELLCASGWNPRVLLECFSMWLCQKYVNGWSDLCSLGFSSILVCCFSAEVLIGRYIKEVEWVEFVWEEREEFSYWVELMN